MIPVTALVAAILALVYVRLSMKVIYARRAARIALGTGEDPRLLSRSRAHANFAEYTPISLILLGAAELNGAHWLVLLALGAALIAGRVTHAVGVGGDTQDLKLRVIGMQLTIYGLIAGAFLNLVLAAWLAV